MIIHERFPFVPLPASLTDQGRVYNTPVGDFPSVTTILKRGLSSEKLDNWKKAKGEEVAEQISQSARTRGTSVHKLFEDYLEGRSLKRHAAMDYAIFHQAKSFLDRSNLTVYGIEIPLYSASLQTAGTADLIARWNSKFNAITDYKTARFSLKPTDDRWLKYRLQSTTYGMMAEELYQIEVPYNMVIVLNSNDRPQIDITLAAPYRDQVRKIFNDQSLRF